MSKHALSLKNDWDKIQEKFQKHFQSQNLDMTDQKIEYRTDGEHLMVWRNGKVSGSMPLHRNEMNSAEKIKVADSEIKIFSGNSTYTFKK